MNGLLYRLKESNVLSNTGSSRGAYFHMRFTCTYPQFVLKTRIQFSFSITKVRGEKKALLPEEEEILFSHSITNFCKSQTVKFP